MAQIDVEDLMSILWAEGYEYEIIADEEDGCAVLRVYGGEARVTIGELFSNPDPWSQSWVLIPSTLTVTYRSGYPFWDSEERFEHDLDEVVTAPELFALIANSLLAQEAL